MSREDMEPHEWFECVNDDCEAEAGVNEYDSDEDAYRMTCVDGHSNWVYTSDETWK